MTLQWPLPRRKKKKFMIMYPENRLASLVNAPGGISRREAIAEAERRVESLREASMTVVQDMIRRLAQVSDQEGDLADLTEVRRCADNLITLATTFKLHNLAHAAMNLVDLVQACSNRGEVPVEAIEIHIDAIKLLNPMADSLPPEVVSHLLSSLRGVLQHWNVPLRVEGAVDRALD